MSYILSDPAVGLYCWQLNDFWCSAAPGEGNNGVGCLQFVIDLPDHRLVEYKLFKDDFVTLFQQLFFYGPQKSPLFQPYHTSTNLCCEAQTFIVKTQICLI